jgi:hypothetical protein
VIEDTQTPFVRSFVRSFVVDARNSLQTTTDS